MIQAALIRRLLTASLCSEQFSYFVSILAVLALASPTVLHVALALARQLADNISISKAVRSF